jgi:hypothetical protein
MEQRARSISVSSSVARLISSARTENNTLVLSREAVDEAEQTLRAADAHDLRRAITELLAIALRLQNAEPERARRAIGDLSALAARLTQTLKTSADVAELKPAAVRRGLRGSPAADQTPRRRGPVSSGAT